MINNQMCKITLGRIVVAARRNQELSQRELAKLITDKMVRRIVDATKTTPQPNQYQLAQLANRFSFDFRELSKIENDHVEIRDRSYDWFVQCFCEIFDADVNWVEEIRQQTEPLRLDLSKAIFPIYIKNLR